MDPVSGLNQIIRTLRRKLSDHATGLQTSRLTKSEEKSKASLPITEKLTSDEVKRKIGERARGLTLTNATPTQKAQLFVEVIMTWEFGEQLLQDPKFPDVSAEIAKTLVDEPAIRNKLLTLLDELEHQL